MSTSSAQADSGKVFFDFFTSFLVTIEPLNNVED